MDTQAHFRQMGRLGQINIFEAMHQQQKKEVQAMLKQAIDKLQAEMAATKNPYVLAVGQFLVAHVTANPADAEKILADKKTVLGSFEAMQKEAMKKKVGNCAVLTSEEGFKIVFNYFGIKAQVTLNPQSAPVAAPAVEVKEAIPAPPRAAFTASLDEFL